MLTRSRFWAEFDPARQMVDIRLGGIITRAPSEVVPLEEVAKRLDSSHMPEQGAFKPGSCIHERDLALHDAKALQRWEFHTMCVIDPFIRVRVSVHTDEMVLFLTEACRTLHRVFQSRCLRDSRRSAGARKRICESGNPIKEEVAM